MEMVRSLVVEHRVDLPRSVGPGSTCAVVLDVPSKEWMAMVDICHELWAMIIRGPDPKPDASSDDRRLHNCLPDEMIRPRSQKLSFRFRRINVPHLFEQWPDQRRSIEYEGVIKHDELWMKWI